MRRWSLGVVALVLPVTACRHTPPRLAVSSVGVAHELTGRFAGRATIADGIVTLHLDSLRVWRGAADGTEGATAALEEVTVRAVLAVDSAGTWIPLGVSPPLGIAATLAAGEHQGVMATELALPMPPDIPARDLWIVFQLHGLRRRAGAPPEQVVAYACSETNLLGVTQSAQLRARRLRASYTDACRV